MTYGLMVLIDRKTMLQKHGMSPIKGTGSKQDHLCQRGGVSSMYSPVFPMTRIGFQTRAPRLKGEWATTSD